VGLFSTDQREGGEVTNLFYKAIFDSLTDRIRRKVEKEDRLKRRLAMFNAITNSA
jgi:hypothetical protein